MAMVCPHCREPVQTVGKLVVCHEHGQIEAVVAQTKPRIFLSYGRGDDEPFVKCLHRELKDRGFDVWWDRIDMPSRKLTFLHEIREAIAARERLLLVLGPHAVGSDYVRQEWQFALEADKVVTPILRLGDYPLVPDELKLLHCEDFREDERLEFHLENLARQLSEPAPKLGKLIAVPSLPPHYLARQDRLLVLRDAIRSDLERPVVITGEAARIGIHGMGGIGKSVLASALAHDRLIREAFPDGIVWVAVGGQPDIAALQRRVHRELGGEGIFQTATEGRTKLRDLLAEKSVLLILDDVWRRADVDDLDVLGLRCRAIVTTRDAGLLTSLGGTHHVVELLTDQEALHLLAMAVDQPTDSLPNQAEEIVHECGRLPLAVALCGGMLQAGTPWSDVLAALRAHELEFLSDEHAAEIQHRSMWRAIEVSVAAVEKDGRQRLAELSVFPPDKQIPEAAIITLWEHTGEMDPRQSRRLLVQLKQRSLVQINRGPDTAPEQVGDISLHELIHDFTTRGAQRYFQESAHLHKQVVDAYRKKSPKGWHSGPNDGYYFQHLCDHFIAAKDWDGLEGVLTDLPFLEAKVAAGMVFELVVDFSTAVVALPADRLQRHILQLLGKALRRDLHFVARHTKDYPQGLFQCLWNTGWWYDSPAAANHYDPPENGWPTEGAPWQRTRPKLYELLEKWQAEKKGFSILGGNLGGAESAENQHGRYWLRSLRPPNLPLGSAQMGLLAEHTGGVSSVVFSPDGRCIASASRDKTVRVWDAESGKQITQLIGHTDIVWSVAYSPDCRHIASASLDKTVRVWDAASGELILQITGHTDRVTCVAFSPDGRRIASSSLDKTVRVWDANCGELISKLTGHTNFVWCVTFSPDGRRIASSSEDKTVRVWDADLGEQVAQFTGHTKRITCVAFSPDSCRIASASEDKTVRVWDAFRGELIVHLIGHAAWVWSVAFDTNGHRIATGSVDKTVRVWDSNSGKPLALMTGHTGHVLSVAFSTDGRLIASGSEDKTIRIWDANGGEPVAQLIEHTNTVTCAAFSPDGRHIASGAWDRTVRVWDAESGEPIFQTVGHTRLLMFVAFSADGRRVFSKSLDSRVRVWNADSGELLGIIEGGVDASAIAAEFAPSAYRLIQHEFETVVESASSGEPLAWFPVALKHVSSNPSGQKWVAGNGNRIYILELVGNE